MARVPVYETPQVAPTALPGVRQQAVNIPDVAGASMQRMGDALLKAGGAYASIVTDAQNEANKVLVDDAMNRFIRKRTELNVEASQARGKDALDRKTTDGRPLSLADEVTGKLDEFGKILSTELLRNDAQRRLFTQQATQATASLRQSVTMHALEQQKVYTTQTQKDRIGAAIDQATLLWNDDRARGESTKAIEQAVGELAKVNGWSTETRDAALRDSLSPMHSAIIRTMISNDAAGRARDYYDQNSTSMSTQDRASLQTLLREATTLQVGNEAADKVWRDLGPKSVNEPVKLFDLEAKVREQLAGKPDAMKAALDGLKQRAAAFNAQQSEVNAGNVNGVYAQIDGGVPMSKVMVSNAWQSLPEKMRHEIIKEQEAIAASRASRAAAESTRALTDMQRKERTSLLRNGDQYLADSDPERLSKMSRKEVEALRPKYGLEGTQHLLNSWEKLRRPDKILEAKMDTDDFNMVADKLGLKPFDSRKSEKDKRALGELKFRVEQLIDMRQSREKRALTREEKQQIMRTEMAADKLVEVDEWGFNPSVPVIALTAEQAKKVVVPAADRKAIVDALRIMYRKTRSPQYEPTEENIRREFLMKKSPAGRFVNGQ